MKELIDYHGIQIDLKRDERFNEFSLSLLKKHYMLPEETSPQYALARASLAYCTDDLALAQRIYDYASKGWFMFASPVISNAPAPGRTWKAMPASCFLTYVDDTLESLIDHTSEIRWLSVLGGGVGAHWSKVRSVSNKAPGPIPFLKTVDADMSAYQQGITRRASYAAYLDISHPDILEFLEMRLPTGGDANRKCFNLHNAVNITDAFMHACIEDLDWQLIDPADKTVRDTVKARDLLQRIVEIRFRTGEPYLCFIDTANAAMPEYQKLQNLVINGTNLCVAGNQRVPTSRGLLTAKELYELQEPLTLFDNTETVQASEMKLIEKNADLYKITLNNGLTHTVTNYHKVMTNTGPKQLKDLVVGEKIAIQTTKGIFGEEDMPDEAFLLGLYQADGTQHKELIMIDIWENDFDLIEEIQTKFTNIHKKYGCEKSTNGRFVDSAKFLNCTVTISNVKKKRLTSRTLKKALNFEKGHIPQWIWESNEKTQWQYIRGLYYADGTINITTSKGNPVHLSLCSINKEFLLELQILLANLGIRSAINLLREAGQTLMPDGKGGHRLYDTKTVWRLVTSNKKDALTFEKEIQFLSRKQIQLEDREYRDNTKKFSRIVSIEYVGKEDVYCCTVYNDKHLWVCNGVITHNCTEIFQPTSNERTAVCVLSSLNLEFFEDWKDTTIVQDLIRFLDNVAQIFIDHAPPQLHKAIYAVTRERGLALGAMGFHSLLQKNMIPWESAMAKAYNLMMWELISSRALGASVQLAHERGSCLDAGEQKIRNAYRLGIAPNANSSIIANTSPSGDPWYKNAYAHMMRAGTFLVKNEHLDRLLKTKLTEKQLEATWQDIILNQGSVQHLDILSDHEKEVFKTAFEIDQKWVIQHASDRQPYICQGQSVNLFFPANSDRSYVLAVHIKAWKEKLKSLYYLRTSAGVNVDISKRVERTPLVDYAQQEECLSCQG